jgi:outer membrane protein assembly factor BamB
VHGRASWNRLPGVLAIVAAAVCLWPLAWRGVEGRDQEWPQWGGPHRDFTVQVTGLADAWPADGPARIWSRALGEGHAAIAAVDGVLYTAYRPQGAAPSSRAQEEHVIALDAATGRTLWEHRYPAPTAGLNLEFGAGPHATPLVAGTLVIAAGSNQQLVALDRKSGRLVWSHDLPAEFGSRPHDRGHASSPLRYEDTVIMPVGGTGQAVMAFRLADGRVAWKSQSFEPAPSSPIIANVGGQDQLLVFASDAIVGLDPSNGTRLWRHEHRTEWGLNISTPVFGPDNQLFISSAYNSGSRLLQLARRGAATTVDEVWFTNRLRLHFGNAIRIGTRYYGSSGDFGPAFIAAADAATGRVAWQHRGFARSWLLWTGDRFIVLDEDGVLGLARPTPEGLDVLARAQVLASRAWTAPSLVGTTLYARDRQTIVALDLGR